MRSSRTSRSPTSTWWRGGGPSPERFLPVGVLYRVDRERAALPGEEEEELWRSYSFGNLGDGYRWRGGGRDVAADLVTSDVLFLRAEYHFRRGERSEALSALERLGEVAAPYRELLQNAGSLLAEKGEVERAAAFYRRALEVDPSYAECRRNYAWVLLRAGLEPKRAIELAERSLEELPVEAWFLRALGDAYRKVRRYRNAFESYVAASDLEPADHVAPRRAAEVMEEDLQKPEVARRFFELSLRRRPTQADLIEKLHGKDARRRYEERARRVMDEITEKYLPQASPLARSASP